MLVVSIELFCAQIVRFRTMENLLCENCHVFQWQIKEENAGSKCECEIRRNIVFRTLSTQNKERGMGWGEEIELISKIYSIVQKRHKKTENKPMETTVLLFNSSYNKTTIN